MGFSSENVSAINLLSFGDVVVIRKPFSVDDFQRAVQTLLPDDRDQKVP